MLSSSSSTGARICYITVPSKEVADKLSQSLVESQLAACVNIIPGIESKFLWQGKIETEKELLLMVKTRDTLTDQVAQHVKKHHPYDTPEFICTDVVAGLPDYLKWVKDSTKSP
ncbi:divalent cation tolerance-related protein [Guillardia theta CCMP2712]|uniref:Divalent cation tolerance-related protein n=1 Tax=Guillardia theta (strain CCMP2712) TaxID=905079 RepID=L1K1L0_GUITC|nr:divalent cation tolerance-related protein [Guillardia theta CCMP2712]EKX54497.1 divalent cation tolerance-related protein [Guillardia theta CCMP2712]|eukprot:XP_005841477.1 divalent cation tolerance-related protein [Guillardia theta CCMP2712]